MGCMFSKQSADEKAGPDAKLVMLGAADAKEVTTISRMDQDILLHMNQGAGENLRLSCWDFGGQDTFYGLHHFYMGRNSVFVVLFNMVWFLPENERDWSKHLDFLAFWLNSIAAHAADPKDPNDMAPIILVGSHKDLVPSPEEHERISEMLCVTFKAAPAWSSVERFTIDTPSSGKVSLCFFPVDNKLGSRDPVITEIKKTVQEVVKKEKYIKKQVPFNWLTLLERVQEKDRPSCLTFDQVVNICEECGMQSTPGSSLEDEALAMLKIFNDLGQLMHHSEPSLQHLVILDPANYLVEPASRIICQHAMHENLNEFLKNARKQENKLLTKLQEKGILDPKLLDIVWEDRLEDKQDLLKLLVKFGFFVPLLRQVKATDTKESAGDLYLVPAILPERLTMHQSTTTPKLVGYLFFALSGKMKEMRTKGYVTVDEVKRDGFFPMGLGPAVTGQIVSECQCLHDMTIDDMQLSSTEISAAFGRHEFILRTSMELQMMQLVIMVDSSLLIVERVLDLVKTAAEKMVPSLEFALAVDLDSGGVCQNGAIDKPTSSLVIISGQGGLQGKLADGGTLEIPVGPGKKWTSVKAQKHFEKWLADKGLREQGYDCFISYRWTTPTSGGMDTKLVDGIYKKLSPNVVGAENRQIHVFLDRHCLEDGGRFDKDFAKALLKSTVVIPIVSYVALQRMVSYNKDSPVDNLLVEWVIIAELQDLGALDSCLPVMLGNVFEKPQKDGKFTSNIFAEGIVAKLPDVVVSKVVSDVQQVFDDNGIASSKHLHNRTVKGTVETIMKGLGVLTWDVVSNPIRGANGDDSMMHTHAEWTRNLFSTVATKAMFCIEKAETQGKAKVTQVCHEMSAAQVGTEASTQLDRDLRNLFEKCGLAEHREKVCDVLGARCVQDIAMAEDGDIETLTWLKPIERRKLKKLIDDSKPDDSTKEEIPVVSSISSGKDKSGKDKSDAHGDKSSMNLPVNIEVDNRNAHENYVEKQLEIREDTVEDTKGDRDKDVSGIQEDTSVVQKKWETISAERAEECRREAMQRGSKPLNTSRLNIVGEGRAGKTAWLRAVSNKAFEDTASTIGVKQSLLEVNKVDMETKCDGGWSEVEEGTLIMKAEEAITRVAAEIAVTKPQEAGLDTSRPGIHSTVIGSGRQQEAILGSSTQIGLSGVASGNWRFPRMNKNKARREYNARFDTLDTDGDGHISAAEFEYFSKEGLFPFNWLDKDNKGRISRKEYKEGFELVEAFLQFEAGICGPLCFLLRAKYLEEKEKQKVVGELGALHPRPLPGSPSPAQIRQPSATPKCDPRTLKMGCSAVAAQGLRSAVGLDDNVVFGNILKEPELAIECEILFAGLGGHVHGCIDDIDNYYSVKFGESGDWDEEEIVIDDKKGKAPIPQHVKKSVATGKYHGGKFKMEEYDNGPENKNKGKKLKDFWHDPASILAGLFMYEVLILRLYTSTTYCLFNGPMRSLLTPDGQKLRHPLRFTIYVLTEGIKKLRAVEAKCNPEVFNLSQELWRGMKNTMLDEIFESVGGTEMAVMSTTSDKDVALKYASSESALVFKYKTVGLTRGVKIQFLSLYPKEVEYVFPPLTFLSVVGEPYQEATHYGNVTIVPVTPQM